MEWAAEFREGARDARASYGLVLDLSGPGPAITSIGMIVFYYFFAPWSIKSAADLYAFCEILYRTMLLIAALVAARVRPRGSLTILFVLGLAMEVLWAVGTMNYGTAMRHKVVTFWLWCLLGSPVAYRYLREPLLHGWIYRRGVSRRATDPGSPI